MAINWRSISNFNLRSIDWMYLFRGKRLYATLAVAACLVTALTVFGVGKLVQAKKEATLYQQGEAALNDKNYDKAIKDLSKLYKDDPNYKDVGTELAQAVNSAAAAKAAANAAKNGVRAAAAGKRASGGALSSSGTAAKAASQGTGSTAGGSSTAATSSGGGSTSGGTASGGSAAINGGTVTGGAASVGQSGTSSASTAQTAKLVDLLPKSLAGYEAMGTQVDNSTNSASRGFDPYDKRKISNLLVTLYDRATFEGAQAYLDSRKQLFPASGKTLTVKGAQAYFGSDSRNINAILVWSNGSVVYELMMQSSTQKPSELQDSLTSVANQF